VLSGVRELVAVRHPDRAQVVRQMVQEAGIEPPTARRAAADVLHTDGAPRYLWENLPLPEREYATVIVAPIAEQRRWRAEHEHAKALAARRAGQALRTTVRQRTAATDAARGGTQHGLGVLSPNWSTGTGSDP
jgi:hypothetical protein